MRHREIGRREWVIGTAAIAASLGVTACKNEGGRGGKPLVVASIFPVYDLARRIGGDVVHVELLLEPGKGVHAYNPTTKDAKRVAGAKLAFIIGLELDDWTTKILEASGGGTSVIALGERVKTAKFDVERVGEGHGAHEGKEERAHEGKEEHAHEGKEEHAHEGKEEHAHEGEEEHAHEGEAGHDKKAQEEKEHGHEQEKEHGHEQEKEHGHDEKAGHAEKEHGHEQEKEHGHGHHHHPEANDPHVWLSVPRAIVMAEAMVEEMSRALPDHATTFQANAKTLVDGLRTLDAEIRAKTATFKKRGFVTFHGSFSYFAEEYDLEIVAVIEPFPDKEPSAMYLKEVLETIGKKPVGALYTEPQLDPRPAQVLAKEAKLPLLVLDPVGGLEGRDSYEALMRFNLGALEESLQ